jgi:molybdopterin biosynthesis enzyme MoaB
LYQILFGLYSGRFIMLIRTGILTIPAYDEAAVAALRNLLRSDLPGAKVMIDKGSEGKRYVVEETLRRWSDEEEMDLILTVGGTRPALGPAAGERVPEATAAVAERALPGLAEAMRAAAGTLNRQAWLDRGVTVIRGATLIINLPAGGDSAAATLAPVLDLVEMALALMRGESLPEVAVRPPAQSSRGERPAGEVGNPSAGRKKGLQADEFAAFLKRHDAAKPTGEDK